MSLLAPLYFLGALAVGLPILFHLIRRQPKGQVEFSSLMFLQPTPPRLTRRSRLENWPLLLLRALALMLLAAAFARPFLRDIARSMEELPGRRLMLLIDTSASMRRAGLWQQAIDRARDVLADLQPADQLAIVTFDHQPTTLLSFRESSELSVDQLKGTAEELLREATPSWHRTELGRAISFAADLAVNQDSETSSSLEEPPEDSAGAASSSSTSAKSVPVQMILISDMQEGSRRDDLRVYAWPDELRLDVRRVVPAAHTNAAAQILAQTRDSPEETDRVRVRVTNSVDASESQFRLHWSSDDQSTPPLPVQVPPGQSRVVRMPAPTAEVSSLVLQGDDFSFDNTRYVVSPKPQALTLLHIGDAGGEPRESLLYYLQRVSLGTQHRTVTVETRKPDQLTEAPDSSIVPLVVLEQAVSSQAVVHLKDYLDAGGKLLVVLAIEEDAQAIAENVQSITASPIAVQEAVVDDYVMLSRIDFRDPVFQPMADPQFNDFSKIRFWSHREVTGLDDSWATLAQFDDGDPALAECRVGEGTLFLLAAGWQPNASQLALSTKFIPLVFSLFDHGRRGTETNRYTLGQPIADATAPGATITGPTGTVMKFETAEDQKAIDTPGVYQLRNADKVRQFAVNLDESESLTEAIADDELELYGAVLGETVSADQAIAEDRQLRDRELEGKQRLWQWLLIAALGLLGLETFLGSRWSRRDSTTSPLGSGNS